MGSLSQVQLDTPSSANEPFFEISHLSVTFETITGMLRGKKKIVRAVDDVSFELHKGEFLAIVGETGSGKSTIARCLLGLTSPSSGSIKHDGVTINNLKGKALREYRKDVQIVYQDPFESLINRQTVLSNISIPFRYLNGEKNKDQIRESVASLLNEVGLKPEIMNRYPHQISGGERQRVSIARALASNPKVLIADEPITMLDAAQRLNVLSLLVNLKMKRNLTLIIITHDLASAVIVGDRILVMYAGKVLESGPARALISRPFHPYVELILESTPGLDSKSTMTDAVSLSSEILTASPGCVFEHRCKYAKIDCKEKQPDLVERFAEHYAACYYPLNQ
ncbi:MAG: ATP-binding cassette domain-containing protein [Thaumarchaeota archaeon]|nr:ATP-binding cassette domain-containing protein [Nitrososphaerota archaeon]